jgi:uncharacterized protein YpuA (DUF1002 family)
MICTEWEKGKLTAFEALKNLGEMVEKVGEDHALEVMNAVRKKVEEDSDLRKKP